VIDALIDAAKGCRVLRKTNSGTEEVYTTPPDRQACTYLIDRLMGQPERSASPALSRSNTPSLVVLLQERMRDRLGVVLQPDDEPPLQLNSRHGVRVINKTASAKQDD
jgi:hypothetical protein